MTLGTKRVKAISVVQAVREPAHRGALQSDSYGGP